VPGDRANGPHPTPDGNGWSLDQLADYAAGLLDSAGEAAIAAALEQDEAAAHLHSTLRHADDLVRAELRALPAMAMPADIAARIDAALAAEAPVARAAEQLSPVVPLRRRRWRAASGAVAAGVVVLAGAAFGISQFGGTSTSQDSTAGAAPSRSVEGLSQPKANTGADLPSFGLTASGVDYRKSSLQGQVTALVNSEAAPHPYLSRPEASADAAPLAKLSAPEVLAHCLELLGITSPLKVDLASYEGEPSVVVVAKATAGRAAVTVAGPDCGSNGADLRVRTSVAATG
jgi:hypothetical protein